jgi:hypothetical protein
MDGASPPDRLSLEAHLGAPEISTGYSSQEGPAHRERIVRHHWRRMVSHKPKEKRSARFAVILVLRQAKFPVGPPTRRREGQKVDHPVSSESPLVRASPRPRRRHSDGEWLPRIAPTALRWPSGRTADAPKPLPEQGFRLARPKGLEPLTS